METFSFSPRIEPVGQVSFLSLKAQFGDGYVQSADNGINPIKQTWPLEFVGDALKMQPLREFLDRHKASRRFVWQPPMLDSATFVVNGGYTITPLGAGVYKLAVTFEQVA